MGIGLILAAISATTAVAGGIMSEIASQDALEQQQQMLETQHLQNRYQTLSRQNQTLGEMRITLQKNEAHEAASGGKMDSPSFFAQQANTIQQGDTALRNAGTAEALNDYSLDMRQSDDETNAHMRTIRNIVQTGGSLIGSYSEFREYGEMGTGEGVRENFDRALGENG